MRNLTVAITQMASRHDWAKNCDAAEALVRQAAKAGAKLILLQELFDGDYFCIEQHAKFFEGADELDRHRTVKRFAALAKELGVVLPVSVFERANTAHYNTTVIVDADGRQLAVRQLTDYTGDKVRTLYPNASELRADWLDPERRAEIVERLEEKGIDLDSLADSVGRAEADPFDLLCHLAYNAPLRTRRERADRLIREQDEFLAGFGPAAREVLNAVLEKYAEHGDAQFVLPDVLKVPPLSAHGQIGDIIALFGGPDQLRSAVSELQNLLYAA